MGDRTFSWAGLVFSIVALVALIAGVTIGVRAMMRIDAAEDLAIEPVSALVGAVLVFSGLGLAVIAFVHELIFRPKPSGAKAAAGLTGDIGEVAKALPELLGKASGLGVALVLLGVVLLGAGALGGGEEAGAEGEATPTAEAGQ